MPEFRRRPTTVRADQFTDYTRPCSGVQIGQDGRTSPHAYVTTMQGRKVEVSIGEWIIAEADGKHYYPIADAEFRRIYEPVNN